MTTTPAPAPRTLIHGDCMDFLRQTPDDAFDLAITDPPYFKDAANKLFRGGNECKTTGVRRNRYPELGHWGIPTAEYFRELQRVSKHQIVWGINYFTEAAAQGGMIAPGRIVWDKVNTKSTFSDCEIALNSKITGIRKFTFMWNGMIQGSTADGTKQEGNKRKNEKRIHPTQKPVQLYRWLLEKYAEPGDSILDTHLGSGSIAIACFERNHPFTGIEKDHTFFKKAAQRIEEQTQQQQLL
jgi:site-specific DNA-methyltransferase (adenine-specific)